MKINRREFIKSVAAAAVALLLGIRMVRSLQMGGIAPPDVMLFEWGEHWNCNCHLDPFDVLVDGIANQDYRRLG